MPSVAFLAGGRSLALVLLGLLLVLLGLAHSDVESLERLEETSK